MTTVSPLDTHGTLEFVNGNSYEGELVSGRMEGNGVFRFPNGNLYSGEFKDSHFHGKGVIHFPDGGMYICEWDQGKEVKGTYIFPDALFYKDVQQQQQSKDGGKWEYCTFTSDRRFHCERMAIPPAGNSVFSNDRSTVPSACFDVGYGYYSPVDDAIFTYSGVHIRQPSKAEKSWIKESCWCNVPQ
eukprot:ANDGO_03725.mRNA.1 Flagellar radial spoke protein 1